MGVCSGRSGVRVRFPLLFQSFALSIFAVFRCYCRQPICLCVCVCSMDCHFFANGETRCTHSINLRSMLCVWRGGFLKPHAHTLQCRACKFPAVLCVRCREQVTASMDAPPPQPARLTALSQLCDAADNNDDVRLIPTLGPAYR